ncbi:transcription factor bHLH120-like [Lycium barbarum]|uniref:transcription factor bHLH120-like n=1 Tax=Lycium barbarum TaxID=112863 RepID=UPI00293EF62C|nr:transcription factor bHLH120-like [Lycium barbarum]
MDNNYLWEIFTNKQNISEDHADHHHQLLQIPNFQLNGVCQQDNQIHNQDLMSDPHHGSSSIITPQFQISSDPLYKSSAGSRSTSIIMPQFETSCDRLYKSSLVNISTSIIVPQNQTSNCDKSSVSRNTSIITPNQFQTNCDWLYKSLISSGSSNLDDDIKKGLRSGEPNKLRKRVVHRNVERHRRQEMASLVASLRSLIPFEFIKAKRSTSDHMQVAVNYIKQLQKNIEELDNRRKKIKQISLDDQNKSSTNYVHNNNNCVTVNKCEDGMEILINVNNSHKEEKFSLSKVLRWLLEEGLNVVSCVNSKQDEWTLIRIQCQVTDVSCMDVSSLEQKLAEILMLNLS